MDAIEMFGLLIAGGSALTLTLAALLRLARCVALRWRRSDDIATPDSTTRAP